jgi:tRNA1Val (adenine37-N6)-methyltransferase
MPALTSERLFDGRLQIVQDSRGYRYSIDAVLLTGQVQPRAGERLADLGTGCGIIPLILAYRHPEIKIYGIELQIDLAAIAVRNVAENRMEDRIDILCRDMKSIDTAELSGPVDTVVANPPYRKPHSGRLNPNRQRAVARHELAVTLEDVIRTARNVLRNKGRLVMIYPAERVADLLICMKSLDMAPRLIRPVYSRPDREAKRVIVEGIKAGRQRARIGPPLMIYNESGGYSNEVLKMFQP